MAGDSRRLMIETTALLLATKGLQGASFSEVLTASGAPRGSIYHHFPDGKDQLVSEAVELARMRAVNALEATRGEPAETVARTFVGLWRQILTGAAFRAGCAVVAVTVAADDERVDQAAGVFRGWRGLLGELLVEGGVAANRAPGLAALLVAACEGAVVVARAERSVDAFDDALGEVIAVVSAAT